MGFNEISFNVQVVVILIKKEELQVNIYLFSAFLLLLNPDDFILLLQSDDPINTKWTFTSINFSL